MTIRYDDLPPEALKALDDIARRHGLPKSLVEGLIDEYDDQRAQGIEPQPLPPYDGNNGRLRFAKCEIVDGRFVLPDGSPTGMGVIDTLPPPFDRGRFVARDVYLVQQHGKWSVTFDPKRVTPVP